MNRNSWAKYKRLVSKLKQKYIQRSKDHLKCLFTVQYKKITVAINKKAPQILTIIIKGTYKTASQIINIKQNKH